MEKIAAMTREKKRSIAAAGIYVLSRWWLLVCFSLLIVFSSQAVANNVSAYVLATGDKLKVDVFGEPDLSIEVVLDETGRVSYPLLGELEVQGKTLRQLEQHLTKQLKGRYLVSPKVRVSIAEYRHFFINGEVNRPGGYAYIPNITLRKAIALSGGLTERASLDRVSVIRENDPEKVAEKAQIDTPIFPGDIVTVQEYRQVFISGEVKRPGNYDFQPDLTLRKVVALAGGFTPRASQSKIQLIRGKESDKEEKTVPLDYVVLPGDIITVGERFF